MLAKRKINAPYILDDADVLEVKDYFLSNEKAQYIVVLNSGHYVKGVIYKDDIKNKADNIMQMITRRLVIEKESTPYDKVQNLLFSLIKEKIDVIVAIDNEDRYVGVWEKNIPEVSDFYEKYIYIKQAGYSIADWIRYYYGKDIFIALHSYSPYTELLLNELRDSGMFVKFIVQGKGNRHGYMGKILERNFADVSIEEIQECDLIINTFMSLKEHVRYLYHKYKKYDEVISMYDIVDELYQYERNAGYMLRLTNLIAKTGRKVYIFDYPKLSSTKKRSERENMLLKENISAITFRKLVQSNNAVEQEKAQNLLSPAINKARRKRNQEEISFEQFKNYYPTMSEQANPHIQIVGESAMMLDLTSPYLNIRNGERVSKKTILEDQNEIQKVHFFGKSWVFGMHCSDEYTIPSFVQEIFDRGGVPSKVYNHGIGGMREDHIVNLMYSWNDKVPKDEIFVLIHMFEDYGNQNNKKVAEETGYVNKLSVERPHEYGEIWVDSGHIGEDGSEMLALQIVNAMMTDGKVVPGKWNNKFNENAGRQIFKYDDLDQAELWAGMHEFEDYKKYLKEHRKKIGAIVMNCNPFTLGHRYLIETAANQCDELYIFVVEEDKSIFSFKDRLSLVEKGTEDLPNITVLHSGNFIISAMTFPGYFSKAVDNNVSVDTSDDITFFAKYIAPTLGINIRFVGEEPIDNVTRQYNETMKEILPKYGIDFVEIPRKTCNNQVISASRVRELLKKGNFEQIKELVPDTTFCYLLENKKNYIDKE